MKSSILKNIIGIIISGIIIFIGIFFISKNMLSSYAPDYSATLETPDINLPTEILYDSNAVPYIFSDDLHDSFFALGFAHARERLFTMDILRRTAEGSLSEVLGSKTIIYDKMFRTLEFKKHAINITSRLDKKHFEVLEAYTKGINFYIKNKNSYSMEFDVFDYSPKLWKPYHSILIMELFAWEANLSWYKEFYKIHLIQKVGKERATEIISELDSEHYFSRIENYESFFLRDDIVQINRELTEFLGFSEDFFHIHEKQVENKEDKNIIYKSFNVGLHIPSKCFVASLNGAVSCKGFTIPGVPLFFIGYNDNIAWSLQNKKNIKFNFEKVDSSNSKYLYNRFWEQIKTRQDTFCVKDSSNAVFQIRKTKRGNLISDIKLYNKRFEANHKNEASISLFFDNENFLKQLNQLFLINYFKISRRNRSNIINISKLGNNIGSDTTSSKVEKVKIFQTEKISYTAKEVVPHIIRAFDNIHINNNNLKTALTLLANWNYSMEASSQTPTIYAVFMNVLAKNIFSDEMGQDLYNEYVYFQESIFQTIRKLINKGYSFWFDDVSTNIIENKNIVIRKSLSETIITIEKLLGKNPVDWQWGKIHYAQLKTFLIDKNSSLNKNFKLKHHEFGGGISTNFAVRYVPINNSYQAVSISALNYIFDFEKKEFLYTLLSGQSGHIFSDVYFNKVKKSAINDYQILLDEAKIRKKYWQKTILSKY